MKRSKVIIVAGLLLGGCEGEAQQETQRLLVLLKAQTKGGA